MTLPFAVTSDHITHAFIGLALLLVVISNVSTRKALKAMSEALTNLTTAVAAVEASSTAVTTAIAAMKAQIATLQASGEDPATLESLTARLKAVSDAQTAALAS